MFKREKELMLFGLATNQYSFRGLWLFLFIYVGASLFAALLTAPAYWGVQWLDAISPSETTKWLLGKRIDIYYDRLRWVPIILGLPWMVKECGLFSLKSIRMPINSDSAKIFAKFFAGGIILSVVIFSAQYVFADVRLKADFTFAGLPEILLCALAGGLIIGFLEELVFRCLIMRAVYTALGAFIGIVATSLFFSYKHFKVPSSIWNSLPGGAYNSEWDIGFFVGYYDTIGISHNFSLMPFCSLFMFAMVLAMIYVRTKVLWGPIAMHAGIVFSIQAYRKIFDILPCPQQEYVGNAGMTNGYLALVLLSIIFVWLCARDIKGDSKSENSLQDG